jgi:hypothetical protein
MKQFCFVTHDDCTRGCVRICRNNVNAKVAPVRGWRRLWHRLADVAIWIIQALAWLLLAGAVVVVLAGT